MTPKQSYDHIADRARRLLRFHDGLVNIRKRRMRKDWKAGFCRLMHWPQEGHIDRIDTKDALIVLRENSELSLPDFSAGAVDDLLRAALALGVSALDRYLHERVVKKVIQSLRTGSRRPAQDKLLIPAALALQVTESVRRASKSGRNVRPANQFRIALQESLHRRTFQSWREVEEAFDLIGVGGLAGRLQATYGIGDISPIRKQLNGIAQRRNLLVHEGDLVRHHRGGKARLHTITRKYVHDSLTFLDELVGNLETVK